MKNTSISGLARAVVVPDRITQYTGLNIQQEKRFFANNCCEMSLRLTEAAKCNI
jgi:hypothetical protein